MSSVRVLLAGPNNYRWRAYHETLDASGFSSRLASNGLECVAALRVFRPNVLVLDPNILWGGGDGVLAVRDEERGLNQNLVMILTAGCEPSLLYRMSDYAIDDLVWQPISSLDLKRRLERLLDLERTFATQAAPVHFAEGC